MNLAKTYRLYSDIIIIVVTTADSDSNDSIYRGPSWVRQERGHQNLLNQKVVGVQNQQQI